MRQAIHYVFCSAPLVGHLNDLYTPVKLYYRGGSMQQHIAASFAFSGQHSTWLFITKMADHHDNCTPNKGNDTLLMVQVVIITGLSVL